MVTERLKVNLSPGEWHLAIKYREMFYGLWYEIYSLFKIKNNKIVEAISIGKGDYSGLYEAAINQGIQEGWFKNKYDGCYERPEYYILDRYKRGNSVNCFWVGHVDVEKELYFPDDPESTSAREKKWINDNKVEYPKIMLWSGHLYFSRLTGGQAFSISYNIDPELLNSPKINNFNEDNSEFHKNNIDNFPDHKKIMEKWISIAAKRHKEFEKNAKIKKHHALDLNKYLN